ncbi:MAG: hypothetical protein AMXMBFR56_47790 [Polyangiaceae bacterium]
MSDRRKPGTEGKPPRRPLLAQGERLKHTATRPRSPNEKFHPFTPDEAWAVLGPRAEALISGLELLAPETKGQHVVFEGTLLPNYLAPSYFPNGVLAADGLYVVGARAARAAKVTAKQELPDQATRTLLIAGSPQAARRFAQRMSTKPTTASMKVWDELRRFADVTLPRRDSVIVRRPAATGSGCVTFEAVITQVFDRPENQRRWADAHFARFVQWVKGRGGIVDADYRRDLGGLTFVPVLASGDALDEIAQFNLLRAIRPMPEIAPFPDEVMRVAIGPPAVSRAAGDGEIPDGVVAVFDGGVEPGLSVFAPFVSCFSLTSEPPSPDAMRHGSMVTGAILYGAIVPGQQLPDPTTTVDHYRVFPLPPTTSGQPDHRLYQMLDKITATLRTKRYSIVALAIGPNDSLDEVAEPDRFTAELDALAVERGITFVCAVGNNGKLDAQLGYDRVQPPGDMVNGIGVGAITKNARDAKTRWERAPYSARGPGREGQRVQPTVVEFGGSDAEPFIGFDERGRLVRGMGTSFAAPVVTRATAGLRGALDASRHRPEILRAFTVHHAERRRGHGKMFVDLGYGRAPASFAPHFECAPNEVTVLYEDELPRDEITALRFPVPHGLADATRIELMWTVSYLSEVDPRDPTDYTVTGISAIFRPDSRVRSLTDPTTKRSVEVRTDLDRTSIARALASGFALSEEPKAHPGWMLTKGEQLLRRDGKWETLVPGRVLCKAGDLFEPRLDLQHLRRSGGQLVRGAGVPTLPFAMLLTIRAPAGVSVYDLVAAQYEVLAPLVALPVRISGTA